LLNSFPKEQQIYPNPHWFAIYSAELLDGFFTEKE